MSIIERTRPERPPYVPVWVVPSAAAIGAALLLVVGLSLWLGVRAEVIVPDVVGVNEAVAEVRLAQSTLTIEVTERPFDASEPGTVLDQDPAPGETLREGDPVRVVVSAGTEEFTMPDVVGLALKIAKVQLEERGLVVRIDEVHSDAPLNTVVSTNPAPGARIRSSDMVRLSVAIKGDATDALLPYKLDGTVVAIDPTLVPGGAQDVTMEVARRLRSLLEASGATVIVTRSATATATGVPQTSSTEITGSVSAVVGLDVPATGAGGLAVLTLGDSPQTQPSSQASAALADSIAAELKAVGKPVARDVVLTDAVLEASPNSPGVRIRLGSLAAKTDTELFTDPAWFDQVARAIYRGLGERLGAK
ncbi:MAG: PASTA domain-containing protein [Coriobacteriia bacterium]|nr:PASTA domain-containing protein [Coriobacteriia bacterium]